MIHLLFTEVQLRPNPNIIIIFNVRLYFMNFFNIVSCVPVNRTSAPALHTSYQFLLFSPVLNTCPFVKKTSIITFFPFSDGYSTTTYLVAPSPSSSIVPTFGYFSNYIIRRAIFFHDAYLTCLLYFQLQLQRHIFSKITHHRSSSFYFISYFHI